MYLNFKETVQGSFNLYSMLQMLFMRKRKYFLVHIYSRFCKCFLVLQVRPNKVIRSKYCPLKIIDLRWMSNLISFSCENFGNQAVKSATLVALVVDPVVPTRVGAEINNQKWVISIPLVQSEEAFGVAEIWSLGQGFRFKVIAENFIISRP